MKVNYSLWRRVTR